jgi:hypothetical protein
MMLARSTASEEAQAVALPRLLAPEIGEAFFSKFWRDLQDQKAIINPHRRNLLRKNAMEVHGQHYPPMQALHWGMTPTIAELSGADLLPSFVYFRLYFEGDICRVHSDRPACERSLSLGVASSDGRPWALDIGTADIADPDPERVTDDFGDEAFLSFPMLPGDGVLYRGSQRRHGRLTPNPNRWSAYLFMQWVERDGPHHDQAFEVLE